MLQVAHTRIELAVEPVIAGVPEQMTVRVTVKKAGLGDVISVTGVTEPSAPPTVLGQPLPAESTSVQPRAHASGTTLRTEIRNVTVYVAPGEIVPLRPQCCGFVPDESVLMVPIVVTPSSADIAEASVPPMPPHVPPPRATQFVLMSEFGTILPEEPVVLPTMCRVAVGEALLIPTRSCASSMTT